MPFDLPYNAWELVSEANLPPWGLMLALVAAGLALAVSVKDILSRGVRPRVVALILLRALAVAAVVGLLLQPALELSNVDRVRNRLLLLVDQSRSMDLPHGDGKMSRLDQAKALVQADSDVIQDWQRRHKVEVQAFAERALPRSLAEVGAIRATGRATDLRAALNGASEGGELAGVILLTDGGDTEGLTPGLDEDSRALLASLKAPVHALSVGPGPEFQDLAIGQVKADQIAFVRNVTQIEVEVRSVGLGEVSVPVTLRQGSRVITSKMVQLGPSPASQRVTMSFLPDRVGKDIYLLEVPVLEGEAIRENNVSPLVVRVTRDRIRVLQVAGSPSWDVRFLRELLKKEPNIDLISFFILRTPQDVQVVLTSELSLIPFPTHELFQEELRSFDLVVFQNFDFRPYGVRPYLSKVREFVMAGGGYVMTGGKDSFDLGGYAGTPIADILPVSLHGGASEASSLVPGPLVPTLTASGLRHPVTALLPDRELNRLAWSNLMPLDGANVLGPPVGGATVLATLPDRPGAPFLAVREVGEGRTMAIATDNLWRWGFQGANESLETGRPYYQLWQRAMRWLIKDPEMSQIQISLPQPLAPPGPVAIDVEAMDSSFSPLGDLAMELEVRGLGQDRPLDVQALKTGPDGHGRLQVQLDRPGAYIVRARASIDQRGVEAEEPLLVGEEGREALRLEGDRALLEAMAGATGGEVRTPEQGLSGLEIKPPTQLRVNQRKRLPLWSNPLALVLVALALGLEWGLRRRWGYL